jgi:hypothetical protein
MQGELKNYTLGRGKLYFDKFAAVNTEIPTGERYLGNTPAITMTTAYQNLDHYSSDEGVRVRDDSVQLQVDRAGTFQCDNINMENIAIMFGIAPPVEESTTAATAKTEDIVVQKGLWYQLGTDLYADGIGAVTNVSVTVTASPVTMAGNYQVDLEKGRIFIEDGATDIDNDDEITVTYDVVVQDRVVVVDDNTQVEGSLRFIADNPKGTNRDYYWPHVRLAPSGEFALKGETWQTMTFAFEILIPKDGRKMVYIREVLAPAA